MQTARQPLQEPFYGRPRLKTSTPGMASTDAQKKYLRPLYLNHINSVGIRSGMNKSRNFISLCLSAILLNPLKNFQLFQADLNVKF